MKVIVASYPKTGTKTLAEALRILGYNVHDTMEHFVQHRQLWYDVVDGKAGLDDIRKSYKDVDAVTAFPTYYFWQQLLQAFPGAQVILTERDENSWVDSLMFHHQATSKNPMFIFLCCFSWTGWKLFYFHRFFFGLFIGRQPFLPFTKWHDSEIVRRIRYRAHNASVLQHAPRMKLLRYNIKQGWGPLCEFLHLEKPATVFPHKNIKASLNDDRAKVDPTFQRMKREACFVTLLLSILALTAVCALLTA